MTGLFSTGVCNTSSPHDQLMVDANPGFEFVSQDTTSSTGDELNLATNILGDQCKLLLNFKEFILNLIFIMLIFLFVKVIQAGESVATRNLCAPRQPACGSFAHPTETEEVETDSNCCPMDEVPSTNMEFQGDQGIICNILLGFHPANCISFCS